MDTFDYEREKTKELLKKTDTLIRISSDKTTQQKGIDAIIGNKRVDFKFIRQEPFLELNQISGTTWCTEEHDQNILIWFIRDDFKKSWCYRLGDLVRVKKELLDLQVPYHTVRSTGTTGWFIGDWGCMVQEVEKPMEIRIS